MLPQDLEEFKLILKGGNARDITETSLNSVVDKIDSFLDALDAEASSGTDGGAINRALNAGGFSNAGSDGIEQVKAAGEIRELFVKTQAATMKEDLEDHIADLAESVKIQITSNYSAALGRGNKNLASKIVAALNRLIRKYGEEGKLKRASGNIAKALESILKRVAPAA